MATTEKTKKTRKSMERSQVGLYPDELERVNRLRGSVPLATFIRDSCLRYVALLEAKEEK